MRKVRDDDGTRRLEASPDDGVPVTFQPAGGEGAEAAREGILDGHLLDRIRTELRLDRGTAPRPPGLSPQTSAARRRFLASASSACCGSTRTHRQTLLGPELHGPYLVERIGRRADHRLRHCCDGRHRPAHRRNRHARRRSPEPAPGIGRALTEHATAWLADGGMRVAVIGTGGDSGDAPARQLYEQSGYRLTPAAHTARSSERPGRVGARSSPGTPM